MPVMPDYFFSKRLAAFYKQYRVPLITIMTFILLIPFFLLPAYQESWLDPFDTLNIPNKILHPFSFTHIGLTDPADPFNPHYFADRAKVQELMHNLRQAKLNISDQVQTVPSNEKVFYFTLHRKASYFHDAADFSLIYYPRLNLIFFDDQQFTVDAATILLLNEICQKMQPGWWDRV
jgi:hypothetical protein